MYQFCYRRFVACLRSSTDEVLAPHCSREVLPTKKSDVTCPECGAGYRRIELISGPGDRGEFRCLVCDHLLEAFDGSRTVALRLTVQPERH
jgi:hypothetical protein